jgi:hypothetical protein
MSTKTWYRDVSHALDELGIDYRFQPGRKHTKVWISRGGKKGLLVISASPSDQRSINHVKATAKRLMW